MVLDVGAKDARQHVIPHTRWLTGDISTDYSLDVVGDLHTLDVEANAIDTFVAAQRSSSTSTHRTRRWTGSGERSDLAVSV